MNTEDNCLNDEDYIEIKLENYEDANIDENEPNVKSEIDVDEPVFHATDDFHQNTPNSSYTFEKDTIIQSLVENIHRDIKQELEIKNIPNRENEPESVEVKEEYITDCSEINRIENSERFQDKNDNTNRELDEFVGVKDEPCGEGELLVSYDFPQFDTSIDSSDGSVLGQGDFSLLEEMKSDKLQYYNPDSLKQNFDDCRVKIESDLSVTETHLISNKLINTTSTITHPQNGIIQSQTTQTLVMEILPMYPGDTGKITENPEEILSTTEKSADNSFQLNSITGDVLPLEAYSLLNRSNEKKTTFLCPKCPKVFNAGFIRNRHMKVHESIERYEAGRVKGLITRKKNAALKKEYSDSDLYKCTCGKKYVRESRMKTCLKSHDDSTEIVNYDCLTCSKTFKTKEDLLSHRKRLHNRKRFPCKFCPTDYSTRKELFRHLRKHQKVQLMEYKVISEIVEGKQKLICFVCNKTYCELSELKSHVMGDHKPPFKCLHCKENFTKIDDFATHIKTTHPKAKGQSVLNVLEAFSKLAQAWKCEECNLQFNQADEFALHQVEKHTKDVSSEIEQFQCVDCRRVFASAKSLNSHRRVHHNTEAVGEEAAPTEQGLMCVYCRKICKDENALTSHMRFHSPDRKYSCKFCDFRFATVEKRKSHAEIHTGSMKYVCFICEYRCSSENRLKNHKMSAKHLSMRDYLLTGKPIETLTPKEEKITETLRDKEWELSKKRKSEDKQSSSTCESTCDVCGDKFPSEKKMLDHKQTHPFIEFPNEDTPSRIFFK